MISNSFEIDFIPGDIHDRSCKNGIKTREAIAWISNYPHDFLWVITTPPLNLDMDGWLHPTIYVDVITYPCSNLNGGLANLRY